MSRTRGHQHLEARGHLTGKDRRVAQAHGSFKPQPGRVYRAAHKLGDVWRWAVGHGVRRWHAARLWARHRRRNAEAQADRDHWRAVQEAYAKKEHAAKVRRPLPRLPLDGFDDVTVSLIPRFANAIKYVIGGYGTGLFQTFNLIRSNFPKARHVYYAINVLDDPPVHVNKAYLDCEPGDASLDQFPGWYHRQRKRGMATHQLGQYCSVSQVAEAQRINSAAGIAPSEYDTQTAHYDRGKHVCDARCGFGTFKADSTQWTDRYSGISLDATHYLHF